ncbi:MAG TPA: TRAP transporter large permease subunit [Bryobacteraceae bacterium]|nr:TRAP transporter large permease subunit [Bryobacteraceae bacterium]
MTRAVRIFGRLEHTVAVLVISLACLLPLIAMVTRLAGVRGIPGSVVFVQQLTLWMAFLGAAMAASGERLLGMSANTFVPSGWARPVRLFGCGLTAAIASSLCWASYRFVVSERSIGTTLALGVASWVLALVMPAGFLLIAVRAILGGGPRPADRLAAALFLLAPLALYFARTDAPVILGLGIATILVGAVLGLPIFATLGGIALLLLWNIGQPAVEVPDNAYSLMVSEVLPSLPLYTLAGYVLVEGGASNRLLRVYAALFGWLPGGLAITTAVAFAIFTFAGSGVTIVSMGGLMLPMLRKAGYSETFSIGLINGSGSLGLLFPPSLPVILYAIYARTVPIETLFAGGLAPGLLMVAMVSAWGVYRGVKCGAARQAFSIEEAWAAVWAAKWELGMPVVVIAGLFGGIGTLVEGGAIAVAYAVITECFILREFSLRRDFPRVAVECVTVVGGVLLIIGMAKGLTYFLAIQSVPEILTGWVNLHIHSKYLFLLLVNVVLLIKGSFMDVFSAIIVMVPLIQPIAARFGIDPVQMGVIFLANLELGYLTPPIGMNLCLSAYRFRKPLTTVYRATLPFYLILLVGVLLITYVPALTTLPVTWFGL